jgi:hypothetical protein
MRFLSICIVSLSLVASAFFISGGIYKTETIQLGLLHKTNIITGSLMLCRFDNGCTAFPEFKELEESSILSLYRSKYRQYNYLSNKKLSSALYEKYKSNLGLSISKSEFNKILLFSPDKKSKNVQYSDLPKGFTFDPAPE